MNKHLRTASAESFGETGKSGENVFRAEDNRPGIEFSRREILFWLLFFVLVLSLLTIVLYTGRFFMQIN